MSKAQSRQKSYVDKRRKPLEFVVRDKVFLKVSSMKGVMRFKVKRKLNPRFIGLFRILEHVRDLAYRLALPLALSGVHNVFHASMFRKYVSDPSRVLSYEPQELHNNLSYEEIPIKILDHEVRELHNKIISLVKALWRNYAVEEATWKREEEMHAKYPDLFGMCNFEDKIYFKGGGNCNTYD